MSTLPSPETSKFPDDSIEKRVYNIIEDLRAYLPIINDRNRLGYSLFKYVINEGDSPAVTLRNAKVKIDGISIEELAKKISVELEKIPKSK
ncbi:MAG: hypothetical protein WCA84_03065 [Ignavibacteriaceae bacterium]